MNETKTLHLYWFVWFNCVFDLFLLLILCINVYLLLSLFTRVKILFIFMFTCVHLSDISMVNLIESTLTFFSKKSFKHSVTFF